MKLDRIYTSGVTPTSLISDHADSGWAGMLRFRVTTGAVPVDGSFPGCLETETESTPRRAETFDFIPDLAGNVPRVIPVITCVAWTL